MKDSIQKGCSVLLGLAAGLVSSDDISSLAGGRSCFPFQTTSSTPAKSPIQKNHQLDHNLESLYHNDKLKPVLKGSFYVEKSKAERSPLSLTKKKIFENKSLHDIFKKVDKKKNNNLGG